MPHAEPAWLPLIGRQLIQSDKARALIDCEGRHHVLLVYFCRRCHLSQRSLASSSASEKKLRAVQMAQAMASMTGLSQGVLPGAPSSRRTGRLVVRASSAEAETAGRRAVLGLMATGVAGGAFAQAAHAIAAKAIKVGPPPPPSGGLPGTENSDEARDFDLPLKNRFYLQPLPPTEAAARAKESAQDIINLKPLIDKKQWPYVMNDLRLKASYLRYDLKTVISSKATKEEKKDLKDLTGKLFDTLDGLDHAAKIKSPTEAEKYYGETKTVLSNVLAKLG